MLFSLQTIKDLEDTLFERANGSVSTPLANELAFSYTFLANCNWQ